MSFQSVDLLRIFQLAIVTLGVIVIYYGSKSYLRTKSTSMLFLTIGFVFVAVGAIVAGVLFELMHFDIVAVETVQAASQTFGFLLIVYSLIRAKD